MDSLLAGGLSTLPLAPLPAVEPALLPDVGRRMAARLEQEAAPRDSDELWVTSCGSPRRLCWGGATRGNWPSRCCEGA